MCSIMKPYIVLFYVIWWETWVWLQKNKVYDVILIPQNVIHMFAGYSYIPVANLAINHSPMMTIVSWNSDTIVFLSDVNCERMTKWTLDMIHLCHSHDDVIQWKHFSRDWPFVWGIHRSSVNYPHKGQLRRAFIFSLICTEQMVK